MTKQRLKIKIKIKRKKRKRKMTNENMVKKVGPMSECFILNRNQRSPPKKIKIL